MIPDIKSYFVNCIRKLLVPVLLFGSFGSLGFKMTITDDTTQSHRLFDFLIPVFISCPLLIDEGTHFRNINAYNKAVTIIQSKQVTD